MHMYKRLMVVAAALTALLIAVPAAAQTQQRRENSGLGIGALGGITWTSANTENSMSVETDFNSGTGWMAGIWFGGNRDGRVGVMGEFSWVVKKNTINEFGEEFQQTLSYIEIPVLLRINAGSLNREKPSVYFLVGPVFDIQVKNELEGVETAPTTLRRSGHRPDVGRRL